MQSQSSGDPQDSNKKEEKSFQKCNDGKGGRGIFGEWRKEIHWFFPTEQVAHG